MSILKEVKEYWQVFDYIEEDCYDTEFKWKVHEELPDSSSYKSENARKNIEHYESINMFNEAELWYEELLRLQTEYPLTHATGGNDG